MPTIIAEGDQTAVIGTEHTLVTDATNKIYVLVVDTGNMVNADILELRIKTKVRTGGVSRQAYSVSYAHVQGDPNKYSVPVPADVEIVATLKQTAGTGRVFPWKLLSV